MPCRSRIVVSLFLQGFLVETIPEYYHDTQTIGFR